VSRFRKIFPDRKPLIAMAHMPALPGTPFYDASAGLSGAVSRVCRDADMILVSGKTARTDMASLVPGLE
jgi:predicted TIM-barrel enzyme